MIIISIKLQTFILICTFILKILILRFSSIGDIVLTTPVIRVLKTQLKEVSIHFATKKQFSSILETNPYIDKLHVLDQNESDFIHQLKSEKFDLIIDLHHNLRTFRIWLNLLTKRVAFDKINFEKWLFTTFKINLLPYLHVVDRYMETVLKLGVSNDDKGLDFFIKTDTNIDRFNLPENYIVYAIGGQHETKKLPENKQIELISNLKEKKLVLIGGKEDIKQSELLKNKFPNIINLCGICSIHESALVMQQSEHLITHDTGMMHIGAALNVPMSVIWGNTTPKFGMYPYYPNTKDPFKNNFEVNNLKCRPCSKLGHKSCPKSHFKCMQEQNFSGILSQINTSKL